MSEIDRDTRGISGLYNLGNTCYMNSALQCLFATDIFNYYLKKSKFKKDLKRGIINIEINKCKDILRLNPHISLGELVEFIGSKKTMLKKNFKNSLTYSLYQVLTQMWNTNCIIKPVKLKDVISEHCPKFKGYQQHDSEELLYGMFDRLHEETKTGIIVKKFRVSEEVSLFFNRKKELLDKIKQNPGNDNYKRQFEEFISDNYASNVIVDSLEYWKSYLDRNNSVISKMFTGLFSSEIRCTKCNNNNINFETFNILELALTNKNNKIIDNLEDCIRNFCEIEEIDGYSCGKCSCITTALKKMSLFQLPPKLIIQLKRFSSKNKSILSNGKINDLIRFPLTDLDLSIAQNQTKPHTDKYNLYATVNHSGGLNGGHYVANCKNLLDKKWYHYNDSRVSYVYNESDILDDSAYILFYEKN